MTLLASAWCLILCALHVLDGDTKPLVTVTIVDSTAVVQEKGMGHYSRFVHKLR